MAVHCPMHNRWIRQLPQSTLPQKHRWPSIHLLPLQVNQWISTLPADQSSLSSSSQSNNSISNSLFRQSNESSYSTNQTQPAVVSAANLNAHDTVERSQQTDHHQEHDHVERQSVNSTNQESIVNNNTTNAPTTNVHSGCPYFHRLNNLRTVID
ncbi:hypothetical protein BLA29_008253 [Euroglyphus maynei]|uniref:Uncharacterized protein n=1 Tax=Euroglyphus maynei TaxID=6958 RepID=A0A1Y3AP30_EURMA|nr:hypothetical protein BLA29_008253 [Euroglyphus maynei]